MSNIQQTGGDAFSIESEISDSQKNLLPGAARSTSILSAQRGHRLLDRARIYRTAVHQFDRGRTNPWVVGQELHLRKSHRQWGSANYLLDRFREHPFGQDTIGKDYFALVMRGTQISLLVAFTVGIVSTIIGTIVGALAGYFRGFAEAFLMRMTDLVIIIPLLALAAVLARAASDKGVFFLALMLAIVTWTGLARLVRGEVLSLREREFVASARAIGTSPWRIIFKHILPNTIGVIIVSATLSIASAILLETSLSYLGFGVQSPDVSLGLLISQYQNAFLTRPWLFWFPGIMILLIALTINFIGDGLRDAFDPRQNRSKD